MIEEFPLLQQPPGSNSCLPTAVRAVLLWYGEAATQAQVSKWCRETQYGCWLDQAMENLRLEGFDVEELIEDVEASVRAADMDAEEPQPVIVTLRSPVSDSQVEHAVVLVRIRQPVEGAGSIEVVEFMDPLTGQIEQDATGRFWQHWTFAGERAFLIRT